MDSTYFKWKWVQDGEVLAENDGKFNARIDCCTDAYSAKLQDNKKDNKRLEFAKMKVTCYDAKTDRALMEKKVYGSFDLGHDIKIQAVEYDEKPRIDIRTWDTSAKGKGECVFTTALYFKCFKCCLYHILIHSPPFMCCRMAYQEGSCTYASTLGQLAQNASPGGRCFQRHQGRHGC